MSDVKKTHRYKLTFFVRDASGKSYQKNQPSWLVANRDTLKKEVPTLYKFEQTVRDQH